jgi:hypothetical protein
MISRAASARLIEQRTPLIEPPVRPRYFTHDNPAHPNSRSLHEESDTNHRLRDRSIMQRQPSQDRLTDGPARATVLSSTGLIRPRCERGSLPDVGGLRGVGSL